MVQQIDYQDVLQRMQSGAQLIEVLPEAAFHEQHIPGAISIPLTELNQHAVSHLDKTAATIVYCWDGL